MTDAAPTDRGGADLPTPRVILEAGSEILHVLSELLHRRLEELAPGQVLEIISSEPSTRWGIPAWCRDNGHELIQMLPHGDGTRFWIRKLDPFNHHHADLDHS